MVPGNPERMDHPKDYSLFGRLDFQGTPWKINMEHNNEGLEDDLSFSIGLFLGSMLIFRGVMGKIYPPWL